MSFFNLILLRARARSGKFCDKSTSVLNCWDFSVSKMLCAACTLMSCICFKRKIQIKTVNPDDLASLILWKGGDHSSLSLLKLEFK